MPVRIIPKRNSAPGYVPRPDELEEGEIAINTYDGLLYAKLANGEVRQIATTSPAAKEEAEQTSVTKSLTGPGELLEYGEWTPQVIALGGDPVTQPSVTYDSRQGVFCRLGPVVVVNGRVRFASVGGAGTALAITGLPFSHAVTREGNSVVKVRGAGTIGFAGGSSALKPLTIWGAGGTSMWLGRHVDGPGDEVSVVYFSPDDATGVIDIVFTYTYQTLFSGGS